MARRGERARGLQANSSGEGTLARGELARDQLTGQPTAMANAPYDGARATRGSATRPHTREAESIRLRLALREKATAHETRFTFHARRTPFPIPIPFPFPRACFETTTGRTLCVCLFLATNRVATACPDAAPRLGTRDPRVDSAYRQLEACSASGTLRSVFVPQF